MKNTAVAADRRVRERYPLLAQAILAGASGADPQHGDGRRQHHAAHPLHLFLRRRRALQQARRRARAATRIDGFNRNHAILGASPACVATHPSDMCVALAALDAVVRVKGRNGARDIPLVDLHRLPGDTPHIETVLEPGELITAVILPPNGVRRPLAAIARCATAPPTPSRWSRWPPASSWRATRSRTCGWRWAASRTSRGAPIAQRRR